MTSNKLRAKICEIFGIFPEELEHNLPVNIGLNKIKKLEALLEGEKQKAYKKGYIDGGIAEITK